MPPDLALLSTLNGSNYPCLELIFMVPKVFEPLKFDCICRDILRGFCIAKATHIFFGKNYQRFYVCYVCKINISLTNAWSMGSIWAESGNYVKTRALWVPYRNFSSSGTHLGSLYVIYFLYTYKFVLVTEKNVYKGDTYFSLKL